MGIITFLIFSIVLIGFENVPGVLSCRKRPCGGKPCQQRSNCSDVCPPGLNCDLRLSCGAVSSIQSIYNVQTNMGVVVDSKNSLSLVFDGTSGKQLIYDHKKTKVVQVSRAWTVSKSSISKYVESISSLKVSVQSSTRRWTQCRSASDEIVSLHRKIITSLEPDIADFAEFKKTDILSISIHLFQELSRLNQQRSLKVVIEKKLKMKRFFVYGGLLNVISTFRGLSTTMQEVQGPVETSILSPSFDLQPIFSSECGSESLISVASQVKGEVEVWKNVKYSVLYKIIREFDGGIYKGLRGIEAIIYHLVLFCHKQISLEVFIDVLIQVTASIKRVTYPMIVQKVKLIKKILMTKLSVNVHQKLEVYINAFLEDKLIINNINICVVVKKYLETTSSSFGVSNVVNILHSMKSNFYGSLSVLFNRMSFFIMTAQAPFYIVKLMPQLKASLKLRLGIPPIRQITERLKPQILREVKEQNIESTIIQIPVLGNMFGEIVKTLPTIQGNKDLWLKEMTKASSYEHLFQWLKFGMGIQGGVKPKGCVHEMGLWGLDRTGCKCWD